LPQVKADVILIALMLVPAAYLYFGHTYELVYVPTPSMTPNLPPGSLALVSLGATPTVGDIAVANLFGAPVVHRVIWINQNEGNFGFMGDAQNASTTVNLSQVEGVVVLALPYIGFLPMSIHDFPWLWMAASSAFVLVAVGFSLATRKGR
jgi:signal peptidase I